MIFVYCTHKLLQITNLLLVCDILGSHGRDYERYCLIDVTSCRLVDHYKFRRNLLSPFSCTLKTEVVSFSEALVTIYQAILYHIPEYRTFVPTVYY
jgi:hypothetical protein